MPKTNSKGGKKPAPSVEALVFNEIFGTTGDDVINTSGGPNGPTTAGDDLVWGDLGNDTIDGGAGNDELHGEEGNDIVYGGDGNDTLYGEDGLDELYGGAGLDTLFGGFGDDLLVGGDDDDTLNGGDGIDILDGEAGNDTLNGDAGDDYLIGGEGDDFIFGGDGDDTIFEGAGSDTIDVGEGNDTVVYFGTADEVGTLEDVDYTYEAIIETTGHGKNAVDTVVGYYIYAMHGSGDVDTILNIETDSILFLTDGTGPIYTESDAVFVQFDDTVTFDVLANDIGVGLTITDILDIGLDLDGDGVVDDLIPDGFDWNDLTTTGIFLNDGPGGTPGSILTLDPITMELTWDPNGFYDTKPPAGEFLPIVYFLYEVTDMDGNTALGDIGIQVTHPAPSSGTIDFEDLQLDPYYGVLGMHLGGPDDAFWITQLSTDPTNILYPFEQRDVDAAGDYDYDDDGDEEFRIWSDPDGTTHELNLTLANDPGTFSVSTIEITDFDAGEIVTVRYWSSDGETEIAAATVIDGSISGDGVYNISAMDIGQISIETSANGSVLIDDIVLA